MALGRCQHCGNFFCSGQCLQAMQSQRSMIDMQALMTQQMQNAVTSQQMPMTIGGLVAQRVALAVAEPKKPLPQEEIICATGGLVGWRDWRCPNFGDVLMSFNGTHWPAREAHRASCKSGHNCLGESCSCGLYAWKDRKSLKVNENVYSVLTGQVWLWGKVIEHELGYRAEYSYPKAFVDTGADAKRLARIYGVKLI